MAEIQSNRSRGWLWVGAAIVLLIGAFYLIRSYTQAPVSVTTAQVSYQAISFGVSTNGKVEPVQDFQAHAPLPGVVEKLFVQIGTKVGRGQELVHMDTSDAQNKLAAAQANLQSAKTALQNIQQGGTQDELLSQKADLTAAQMQEREAKTSVSTLQALQAKGSASANEVAAAQQRLADAQAKIAQIQARRTGRYSAAEIATQRAQVAEAQSALGAAQSGYAGVDIRAPFAGTVYSLPINQFDYVSNGEALLNLADLTRLQVRAYFDEPDVGKLANGQPVTITWDAKPGQTWHGHVALAPTTIINYGTRNVGECLISVDDAKGDLLPNTNVIVKVTTQQKPHALSIPREALRTEGAESYVYKIADGVLKRTAVQVGTIVNQTTAEIAGGIREGDTVVLGATSEVDLHEGMPVKAQR